MKFEYAYVESLKSAPTRGHWGDIEARTESEAAMEVVRIMAVELSMPDDAGPYTVWIRRPREPISSARKYTVQRTVSYLSTLADYSNRKAA